MPLDLATRMLRTGVRAVTGRKPRLSDSVHVFASADWPKFEQDHARAQALRAAIDFEEQNSSGIVPAANPARQPTRLYFVAIAIAVLLAAFTIALI
jgi:hypothetical protein